MLVVDFVRLENGHEISVFSATKPLESLVDENVMNQKIGQTIGGNPRPNPHAKIPSRHGACNETPGAGHSENQEESVILFKKTRLVNVVVLMEKPHHAVHYIFVGEPGDTFHGQEGRNHNECR